MADAAHGYLRIGELSRRVGVSPELLRAWETRYGLLRPSRSQGGFRLYSDEDEARVRLMRMYQERGLSAAQAAELANGAEPTAAPAAHTDGNGRVGAEVQRLSDALDAFDEAGAHAAFDLLVAALSVDALVREAVIPYLEELGRRWERGEASVGQEHFASTVIRGRLLGLSRGWGQGPARAHCSPARRRSSTDRRSSASASPFARAAGGSRTSGRTPGGDTRRGGALAPPARRRRQRLGAGAARARAPRPAPPRREGQDGGRRRRRHARRPRSGAAELVSDDPVTAADGSRGLADPFDGRRIVGPVEQVEHGLLDRPLGRRARPGRRPRRAARARRRS